MTSKKSQELPKRDQAVFKTVMKCYEQKQYKKGLKSAEQILKKHPNHGETLSMKGLILNCLKRKDEAETFAKKGLFSNLKSHVCWHVYGLIHRSERRYQEAIKCYQNALKYDKDNLLILKDLSLLQIQKREHQGFQETRRRILILKSDQRINWIAYAVGNHLLGNYSKCLHILDTFIKTLDDSKIWDYQESEMFLYRNSIIQESGDHKAALEDLKKIESDARDKQYIWKSKALLHLKLGDNASAEKLFRRLLEVNNEEHSFHEGLQRALNLEGKLQADGRRTYSPDQVEALCKMYDGFKAKWRYCSYAKRFPLLVTSGSDFEARVDGYMRPKLRKGVPSLFRDLKSLYDDKEKVTTIEKLMIGYKKNLETAKRFSENDEKDTETPNVLVWVIFYLASHYEYLDQYPKALELIDEGITHTPTAIDLYVLKARVYKHVLDYEKAFEILNYARELDLADRYLNTKCVRYAFRAGKVKEAERIVKLFLRETDTLDSLFEMQAMWYEVAAGKCYIKQKNYPEAMTKLFSVEKHFEDISEDQFDFHTWCLRKSTLRAYVDMLRYQENIRGHKFFKKGAVAIIETYIKIHDNPNESKNGSTGGALNEAEMAKLTPKERRALKKRQKRQANKRKKKQEAAEAKKKAAEADGKQSSVEATRAQIKESIPDGQKLASDPKPLDAAAKMVRQLQDHAPNELMTHIMAMEVYSRKSRYLLALQAVKKAYLLSKMGEVHPKLHYHIVLLSKVFRGESRPNPIVCKVFELETASMSTFPKPEMKLEQYNDAYISKYPTSVAHRLSAARVRVLLGEAKENCCKAFFDEGKEIQLDGTIEVCVEALEFVKSLGLSKEAEYLRAQFFKKYPLTPQFRPSKKE